MEEFKAEWKNKKEQQRLFQQGMNVMMPPMGTGIPQPQSQPQRQHLQPAYQQVQPQPQYHYTPQLQQAQQFQHHVPPVSTSTPAKLDLPNIFGPKATRIAMKNIASSANITTSASAKPSSATLTNLDTIPNYFSQGFSPASNLSTSSVKLNELVEQMNKSPPLDTPKPQDDEEDEEDN